MTEKLGQGKLNPVQVTVGSSVPIVFKTFSGFWVFSKFGIFKAYLNLLSNQICIAVNRMAIFFIIG